MDPVTSPRRTPQPGLNVAGFFRAELGVGESARLVAAAVEASGIPFRLIPCSYTASRQRHPFAMRSSRKPAFDTNVVCVNGFDLPAFAADAGPRFFDRRYTIGVWHWEVAGVPREMMAGAAYLDEIWVGSDFTREALARACPVPVYRFPMPVIDLHPPPRVGRSDIGLPDGFLFLFLFDFLSGVERKNPLRLIEAFRRAFPDGVGPWLILKSINGDLRPGALEQIRHAGESHQGVSVLDGYLTHDEKAALVACCDCYVSLHRGEGFGLTMVEAMALGKPVIATAYSGNLEFMTAENSFLVRYELEQIPRGCDPYPAGAVGGARHRPCGRAHAPSRRGAGGSSSTREPGAGRRSDPDSRGRWRLREGALPGHPTDRAAGRSVDRQRVFAPARPRSAGSGGAAPRAGAYGLLARPAPRLAVPGGAPPLGGPTGPASRTSTHGSAAGRRACSGRWVSRRLHRPV